MSGVEWVPGVERLPPSGSDGSTAGGAAKAVVHTTEGSNFDSMHNVLTDKQAEPHILYDPDTDRMGQYFPLNRSARALKSGSGTSKNKDGSVVIQIEVCAYAAEPFTAYWQPGPNWAALLDACRSWGVPDNVWPAGSLATHGEDVSRSSNAWALAGWRGHCNVPDNDHWDPGGIDQAALFTTRAPKPDDVWQLDEEGEEMYLVIRQANGAAWLLCGSTVAYGLNSAQDVNAFDNTPNVGIAQVSDDLRARTLKGRAIY